MPTFGSLFAGIGGIDLGLERAGWQCKWQVEIDQLRRRVLQRHWPDVSRHSDVRDAAGLEPVDLIVGGFPCQDVSHAGRRYGIKGSRSGLWRHFARLLGELRPRFGLVENTPGLLSLGMGTVLGDLARLRYDAEWGMLRASDFGAPHTRRRLFILAYSQDFAGLQASPPNLPFGTQQPRQATGGVHWLEMAALGWEIPSSWLVGSVDGLPHRLERTRATGDAVVPAEAEWLGQRILDLMQKATP